MKKLVLTILMLILVSSIVMAGECTQSGYDYCYKETYSYGDAYASAKIYFTIEDNDGHSTKSGFPAGYAVGDLHARVGYSGDKLLMYKPISSWDAVSCGDTTCRGTGHSHIDSGNIP
jgi:hypothetical protein